MAHRSLSLDEIHALKNRGCTSSRWEKIHVAEGFDPKRISNVHFSGDVAIGQLEGNLPFESDGYLVCGINHAHLHNCSLGDHVCIRHVGLLSNCRIEDHAIIMHSGAIRTSDIQAFGNGMPIDVLNEAGGRRLILTDTLSAQIAYLMVTYRQDEQLIARLEKMLSNYAAKKKAGQCTIGRHAVVVHCGEITNVCIGPGAVLRNCRQLDNGTIASSEEYPAQVGAGVIARDFIFQEGSVVDSASVIERSLVGQGTHVGKQFSMTDSVFFSNAVADHGEAVAVFAGPHSVTHHKSTLLIAGMFSFFNAGSGSNQSNHMYRLGPVHQGIVERGSKTGSFSYLRWPCRVGAFSMVLDKHSGHFDASEFPFSYITAEGDNTYLIPAMHFFSAGIHRDAAKWPQRDRRPPKNRLDQIHYELLSPYTMQRVVRAVDVLEQLLEKMSEKQQALQYKGVRLKKAMILAGIRYYRLMIPFFIGNQLIWFASAAEASGTENTDPPAVQSIDPEEWCDVAGLLAQRKRLTALRSSIVQGTITGCPDLQNAFEDLHAQYHQDCRLWTRGLVCRQYASSGITADLLQTIADDWAASAKTIYQMILRDAKADFGGYSKIGYGVDGCADTAEDDFNAVRGMAEKHPFIVHMTQQLKTIHVNCTLIRDQRNQTY
jgi:carbonic anhydrase/acetyltransferase-like protein (isoleucine patch superfamily)